MTDIILKTYPHGTIVARYKLGGPSKDQAVCHIIMIRSKKFLGIYKYNKETELKPRGLMNVVSLKDSDGWKNTDYVKFARSVESDVYKLEQDENNRRKLQDNFLNKFK